MWSLGALLGSPLVEGRMIAFREFTKTFGSRTAVDSLSLEVGAGEVLALLGPNGSGKTTSIKAAAGLIRPSQGAVLVGQPPRPSLDAAARGVCAFLPQRVSFPEQLTGREVVAFYGALRGEDAGHVDLALAQASLNGASRRPVGTYSGGMVQRLGLAVALASSAPIVLLDEPTAALDPDGLSAFYTLVEQHRQRGQTVLFSSHQLGDVERLADRVAIIVAGRLVATFTARELAERLTDRGLMRVTVNGMPDAALASLRRLAPDARLEGVDLVVPGPARLRPAVLDAVRASGIEILGLTAEEGRLDALYRELVGGQS